MSNIIKSRYIYVNDDNKKIIDSNEKSEQLRILQFERQLNTSITKIKDEFVQKRDEPTFTEGLNIAVIEKVLTEEESLLEERSLEEREEQVISGAKEKAAQILKQAEADAKKSCELLYEEAQKKGYEVGLRNSIAEMEHKKIELAQLSKKYEEDYLVQLEQLEPEFVNIVALLVERLTGIIVDDKKEVILHLIHNAMMNSENSPSFIIKVSKEDYDFVQSKKEVIESFLSGETTIDVVLDHGLNKSQCYIVTDTRIINCSLDVQLTSLIQDLKLLSYQKE